MQPWRRHGRPVLRADSDRTRRVLVASGAGRALASWASRARAVVTAISSFCRRAGGPAADPGGTASGGLGTLQVMSSYVPIEAARSAAGPPIDHRSRGSPRDWRAGAPLLASPCSRLFFMLARSPGSWHDWDRRERRSSTGRQRSPDLRAAAVVLLVAGRSDDPGHVRRRRSVRHRIVLEPSPAALGHPPSAPVGAGLVLTNGYGFS